MAAPIPPRTSPNGIDVTAGVKYVWCVCGRRRKQPFCDGSHSRL